MTPKEINDGKRSKKSLNTVSTNSKQSALKQARTKNSVYQLNNKPISKQIIDPNNERVFQ